MAMDHPAAIINYMGVTSMDIYTHGSGVVTFEVENAPKGKFRRTKL